MDPSPPDNQRFKTVLRTSDVLQVDAACALLESEGIPTQHVGRNHAALVPGTTFIVVEVRVPEDRYETARELLDQNGHKRAPGATDSITFRLERNYGALGGILGAVLGGVASFALYWLGMEPSRVLVILTQVVCVLVGYMLGRNLKILHCSKPDCAGRLTEHSETCPNCGAAVRGTVQSQLQHLAAIDAIIARSEPPPRPQEPTR